MRIRFRSSLRLRIALRVALPMIVALSALMLIGYQRDLRLIRRQMLARAEQAAEFAINRLKQGLASHDLPMLAELTERTVEIESISRILIIDSSLRVTADTSGEMIERTLPPDDRLCVGCHNPTLETRPGILPLPGGERDEFVVAVKIENEAQCQTCHPAQGEYLGVLLVVTSAAAELNKVQSESLLFLGASIALIMLVSFYVYFAIHRLVTKRIESLEKPLNDLADGGFDLHLELGAQHDELDNLACMLNRMAAELERYVAEEKDRGELLHTTIITERERIARELHDTLPQLQGYLNAKLGATQLLLDAARVAEAQENLEELTREAQQAFADVREAIIGLRMSRQIEAGLARAIEQYAEQFTRFCGVPVEFVADDRLRAAEIEPVLQVQVLRIVQEALSNVRKHASASRAWVELGLDADCILATIGDDGRGMQLEQIVAEPGGPYGLQIMRERAESSGGELSFETAPGAGMIIRVQIPTLPVGCQDAGINR